MISPADLFNLDNLTHANLFKGIKKVWETLDHIKVYTQNLIKQKGSTTAILRKYGDMLTRTVIVHNNIVYQEGFELLGGDPTKQEMQVRLWGQSISDAAVFHAGVVFMDDDIYIAPGTVVESGAVIKGPTYISPNTEIRHGAYLRGSCLIGQGCVIGHSTELKNVIMLDGAKASHFAYLGDSILGREVNLGAGTKLANLKIIDKVFKITVGNFIYLVNRRKFGAIMGDNCQTGCNSVTNPGTIFGQRVLVAPCKSVAAGFYPSKSVIR